MKGKWKLFGSLIGVSVAAVGTVSVVANYKDTQFQPNAYADARERKDNQIVFRETTFRLEKKRRTKANCGNRMKKPMRI